MELLNHFVASRLMKDAELFERIARYETTQVSYSRVEPQASRPVQSWRPTTSPANDDSRMQRSG